MFILPKEDELPNPLHQYQQRFPMQPKTYETAEDMKRLKDWAVSVVKCGLNSRNKAIQVRINGTCTTRSIFLNAVRVGIIFDVVQ